MKNKYNKIHDEIQKLHTDMRNHHPTKLTINNHTNGKF